MARRSCLPCILLLLLLFLLLCSLSSAAGSSSPISSYSISINSTDKMPLMLHDFPNFAHGVDPLGPFPSLSSLLQPGSTSRLYADWWQLPVDIGFDFPFFNATHRWLTVTSKGYLMLGQYELSDDVNLQPPAPDYLPQGAGFPLDRAVISFYHTAGLSVLNSDTVTRPGDEEVSIRSIYHRTLNPVGTSYSASRALPPPLDNLLLNSDIEPADGQRFVLQMTRLVDVTGFQVRMTLILCQSGKIVMRYYGVTSFTDDAYYYGAEEQEQAAPLVSVGIQQSSGVFLSLPWLSQQSIEETADNWVGASVTFAPTVSA